MNLTRLDRFSYGLAATVLVAGVAGIAGTAQADTVTSASALLDDSPSGAIVSSDAVSQAQPLFATNAFDPEAILAQTTQPTPLESPNELPPPGNPVPGQPSRPGPTTPPTPRPTPPAGSTPGTITPPGTIPPRSTPPAGSTPGTITPPPSSTPGTLPTPLESPNQLPPPGEPIPGQPSEPSPTVPPPTSQPLPPPTSQPLPPPTTRPEPPPRPRGGIEPGRATATGASYVGLGGNLGLGTGGSAVGDGSFAIFSKVGLTQNLSVRPAVLFSDNATFLIPVTLDFIPLLTPAAREVDREFGIRVAPYIGAGAAISTGDNSSVDFLVTGGLDVPVTNRLTATAQVNVTFIDNTAVGLLLGLGYNF